MLRRVPLTLAALLICLTAAVAQIFVPQGFLSRANTGRVCAATSYANTGGGGDRTAIITVTDSGITWTGGTTSNFIDGAFVQNTTDSIDSTGVAVTGTWIQFDFGVATFKLIDEIKLYAQNTNTSGSFTVRASNNGSTFDDYRTFTYFGNTVAATGHAQATDITAASGGYRYFRLSGNSGAWASIWQLEIEFKIAACV